MTPADSFSESSQPSSKLFKSMNCSSSVGPGCQKPTEGESSSLDFDPVECDADDESSSDDDDDDDEEEELGEDAYAMMTEELVEYADALELQQFEHEQETLLFPNEAEAYNAEEIVDLPIAPVVRESPSAGAGICNQLLKKVGLTQTSSSIDYGLRMRRSFRVGKTPRGNA